LSAVWAVVSPAGAVSGLAVAAGGDEVSAEGAALAGGEACVGVAGLGAGGGKRGNCTQSLLPAVAAAVGAGRVADRLSLLDALGVATPVLGAAGAGSGAVIGAGAGADLRGNAGNRIQSGLGNTTPAASRLVPKSPADCACASDASSIPAGSSRQAALKPTSKTFKSSLFSVECIHSDARLPKGQNICVGNRHGGREINRGREILTLGPPEDCSAMAEKTRGPTQTVPLSQWC